MSWNVLLVVIIFCALLLGLFGSLPGWASFALSAAGLAALVVESIQAHRDQAMLRSRRQKLGAAWAVPACHLSGLPLPQNSQGHLFLLPGQLLFETAEGQLTWNIDSIDRITAARADQIRCFSDKRICSLLGAGTCRSFSPVREMIRHRDPFLRRSTILFLVTRQDESGPELLVLAIDKPYARLWVLLRHTALRAVTVSALGEARPGGAEPGRVGPDGPNML